ncbi:hypothetical protein C8R45DRAFT_501747 [Mycena sanguinolenta]|nr:hypothetical protein C8R45DRAFT_501747 [Mycena sanguinolenta]
MDPPAESEPDFSLVSTNNAQWTSYSGGFLPLLSPFFPSTLPTMYPQAESEPDFSVLSTNNPQWTSYAGTFLPQASAAFTRSVSNHYHITGGVGGPGGDAQDQGTGGSGGSGHGPTLNFYNSSKESLSPFRTILLGDLDLVKCLDGQSGVGRRRNQRAGVRRMYSANLVVRESERKVTVAIYQGNGAEEEWRRDYAAYESIRHPNILQLYGVVNSKKL